MLSMQRVYLNFVVEFGGKFSISIRNDLFICGYSRVATIYSLAFSPDAMFLAASSNTETIHIFRLLKPQEK